METMKGWLAILVVLVGTLEFSNGKLTVETTETGFVVSINSSVKLIEHEANNPAFYVAQTIINFEERQGNFIINESNLLGPVGFDQYSLTYGDVNGRETIFVDLTSSVSSTQGVRVELWEGDKLNGVDVSCSFKIELVNPSEESYNRIILRTVSTADEHLYGLGEQFTHFDLKGYNYTIWTREQGVGRNKSDLLTQLVELGEPGAGGDYHFTYYPQSSYISAQSRYLFGIKSKAYSIFDFQNDLYSEISFQTKSIEGYFIVDDTSLLNLVSKVSQVYGRQPELPEWVYNGAILGVQGGTDQMLEYLRQAEENNVPVSAMWIQDWSGKINTGFGTRVFWNWKWNSTWYPRLDEVMAELKETKGVRTLAYINPSLNIEGDLFKEGDAAGVFLRKAEATNETYVQDFGDFYCGTVDFWNSEAVEWYKSVITENMIQFGFSGWMADFGEYTPLDSTTINQTVKFDEQERHNQLPTLWAKLNRDAVEEAGALGEVVFWTRSGSSGSSRYSTLLWGGDQNVDWSYSDGLPSAITAGLSAGMSGMGLFHFDVGGYTTLPILNLVRTKELLLRSAEFAVFSNPIIRTHEGNQPAANHQVYTDTDTWQQFGRLTRMFVMLSNYTKSIVKENADTGIPLMRPLFLHYESDPQSFDFNYSFLYGRDLLVAPILSKDSVGREVYLPPDVDGWVELWNSTETILQGPTTTYISSPLGYPPVLFRPSSPFAPLFREIRDTFGYDSAQSVIMHN